MPYLTDLAAACRKSGLNVIERRGWKTRGHGAMRDVRTLVCHHTAGPAKGNAPSLDYIEDNGLSQIVLARDATVYVVAAGVCWHAGVVKHSDYSNWHAIGIEAEATGVDPWPEVQYDGYVRLARALQQHYGLPVSRVLGHKEVCSPPGRKIDPNFDMAAFRAAIINQEDDVALDKDDIDRITRSVVNATMRRNLTSEPGALTVAMALRQSARSLTAVQNLAQRLPLEIDRALDDLDIPEPTTGGGGLTREHVREAAARAVREVLGSLDEGDDEG